MDQRALNLFMEMVKIPSESREERRFVDYLKGKLVELGFEVTEDNAGEKAGSNANNLIAKRKGEVENARPIFFSAHMDTVKPGVGIEPVIKNGVLVSKGDTILGADNKAGLTAAICGVERCIEQKIPLCDIEFWFSICEEVGLLGATNLDLNTVSARTGYVLDGGGPIGGYVKQGAGRASIVVKVKGKAAHAGAAPEKGLNAIAVAADMISRLRLGRIDSETTINFGIISGGKETNVVPDYVEIKGESRSLNSNKLQEQLNLVQEAAKETAEKWNTEILVSTELDTEPLFLEDDSKALEILTEAIRAVGREPEAKFIGGGSDANVYSPKGVDVVVVSIGAEGGHSLDESIPVEELEKAVELIENIVKINSRMS